jgi:hypothetical protein
MSLHQAHQDLAIHQILGATERNNIDRLILH